MNRRFRVCLIVATITCASMVALALFITVSFSIWSTTWPSSNMPMAVDNVRAVGRLIMTEYVLPFEIVSVLLLAAMIGAIVIAAKEKGREQKKGDAES